MDSIYFSNAPFLSKFIEFTPGKFVLVLRWIHLISWLASLFALWWVVGYHFEKGLQQILATALLAVRPALDYFSNSLKPEPLVLLLMLIGFHFILKMLEKPSMKFLIISMFYASIAFYIKFAGIFLLPPAIAAMNTNEYAIYKVCFLVISASATKLSALLCAN